jgi:Tol biopolymer transport system component
MLVRWTPDGHGLAYIDNRGGVSNIWMQPIDGGKPVQLTDFKTDMIFGFNWSPDGRQLGLARGVVTSDVVLFSDVK